MRVLTLFVVCCLVSLSSQREWRILIDQIQPFPETNIVLGDSVRWVNQDDTAHRLNGTLFDSGVLEPGDEFEITLEDIQQVRYVCTFHPDVMTGKVNVFAPGVFSLFPDVQFSSNDDYYSPLPGYSFSVVEAVSTAFSTTSGIFGFEDGFSPTVRQVSPNYFLSPDEIPDCAVSMTFPVLLLSLVLMAML